MATPKAMTIKEAIKRWEEKSGQQAATATEVSLIFQWPPIEKMDNSLACLTNCEKLSLSTNMIEKVAGLNSLKKIRVLSLGRNYIKSFSGMECLGDTLEELWISYNLLEKLKGINVLKNLKVLYMSNNLVKEWSEFNKLQELPHLEDLLFVGNPLYDACELDAWRSEAARRLPNLKKLDGETVLREDDPPLTVADMQIYDRNNKRSHVVDAADANRSNWMRYVNCSRHWSEQNLVAYQYQGQLYYRTIKIIPRFTELLVFYGSEFANILHVNLGAYNAPKGYASKFGAPVPKKPTPPTEPKTENIISSNHNKCGKTKTKFEKSKKDTKIAPVENDTLNTQSDKTKCSLHKLSDISDNNDIIAKQISQSKINLNLNVKKPKLDLADKAEEARDLNLVNINKNNNKSDHNDTKKEISQSNFSVNVQLQESSSNQGFSIAPITLASMYEAEASEDDAALTQKVGKIDANSKCPDSEGEIPLGLVKREPDNVWINVSRESLEDDSINQHIQDHISVEIIKNESDDYETMFGVLKIALLKNRVHSVETIEAGMVTEATSKASSVIEVTSAPSPIQATRAPSPIKVTRAPSPSPIQATRASSPIEGTRAPSLIEATRAPSLIEATRAPSPIEATRAPSPIEASLVTNASQIIEANSILEASYLIESIQAHKSTEIT
ncbi:unnamed protein product [Arctia plantaginis]|uniref:Dynein axonemal light chain 1 n=1 Tax=Arctia plantaginis TaxID=874455 RepID=A0A8S1A304_ARCPL|nr:unnamed protein product [Arctia plantaginis]